jgi:hypothetical protein
LVSTPAARPFFDADARDVGVCEHLAAVRADARDQGVGELARAADGDADAVGLEECDEHEHADARRLLVRRHEVLAGDARKMHADFVVLEQRAQQIVRAHLHVTPQLAALSALVHQRIGRTDWSRRRIERTHDHRQIARGLRREPPIGLGILLRELGDLRAALLAVAVQPERRAVLEHGHHRQLGEHVRQAVLRFELQLVVLQERVGLNEDVRHRVLIVQVARQREGARDDAAAEPGVALEDEDFLAGGREIGRSDEAVMTRADGDDVVVGAHSSVA